MKNVTTISTVLLLALSIVACDDEGETIELAAGFSEPHIVEGRSGGNIDAATLNAECVGNVAENPDYALNLAAAMGALRVYAHSDTDITLVIQKPDGSYLCNDDMDGTDPLVTADAWPAGAYKIWVGNYDSEEGGAAFKLAFSMAPDSTPSQLN